MPVDTMILTNLTHLNLQTVLKSLKKRQSQMKFVR